MLSTPAELQLPGHRAERLLESVLRFRKAWPRYHRPEDVAFLMRLFPHVSLKAGYTLDYLTVGMPPESWIWPYARRADAMGDPGPPPALKALGPERLARSRGTGELRRAEVETLYSLLSYPRTADGLFEYAFFISELWAFKSAHRAADWLEASPVFSARRFDEIVRRGAPGAARLPRPASLDPAMSLHPSGGGEVRFLIYREAPHRRLLTLRCRVEPDGFVRREPGEVLAQLG
jgi:hypothetical protein